MFLKLLDHTGRHCCSNLSEKLRERERERERKRERERETDRERDRSRERERETERQREGSKNISNLKNLNSNAPEKLSPATLVTNFHKSLLLPLVVRP